MKHIIQPITANEYLGLVNSESHPSLKHKSTNVYRVENTIYVVLSSGVGRTISAGLNTANKTDEEIEKFIDDTIATAESTYKQAKDQYANNSFESIKTPFAIF